ncbi:hypothetical protein AAHB57_25675 [Bacillus cereus]
MFHCIFLICIYNRQEMNNMMYSYHKTYSYFDFAFFMLGSKYDPIHYRLLETMVMILPYVLSSYLTAIYSLEEGILKSYMTIPRVKSLFKWYVGHIVTLIITCSVYIVIEHICIFIVSLDLPKHVLNSDNELLPVITNPVTTMLTVIGIQIISMLFSDITTGNNVTYPKSNLWVFIRDIFLCNGIFYEHFKCRSFKVDSRYPTYIEK